MNALIKIIISSILPWMVGSFVLCQGEEGEGDQSSINVF
jgi:hypothetical protein